MAVRSAEGVTEWKIWGPGGGFMVPVGFLPPRTPPPLIFWTFEKWQTTGRDHGIIVKEFQEPLYYFVLLKKIERCESTTLHCTRQGCGRVASVMGVMVRHYPRRQDLCSGCAANAAKRGLLSSDRTPQGVPRRHWSYVLRQQGAIMPAA